MPETFVLLAPNNATSCRDLREAASRLPDGPGHALAAPTDSALCCAWGDSLRGMTGSADGTCPGVVIWTAQSCPAAQGPGGWAFAAYSGGRDADRKSTRLNSSHS